MALVTCDTNDSDDEDTLAALFLETTTAHDTTDNVPPKIILDPSEVPAYFISRDLATELYLILRAIHEVFTNFGIEYWIAFGSLIGYHRHGGIIPWDDDIDICCRASQRSRMLSDDVIAAFRTAGVFLSRSEDSLEKDPMIKIHKKTIAITKKKKNLKIPYPFCDVFFMREPDSESRMELVQVGHPQHALYLQELYPLATVPFGPITTVAPAKGATILDRGYGRGWKIQGQLHTWDHVAQEGFGGPVRTFRVDDSLRGAAEYDRGVFEAET